MFQVQDNIIKMARGDVVYFDQILIDNDGHVRELNEPNLGALNIQLDTLPQNYMKLFISTTPLYEPNKVSQTKIDENDNPIMEPPDNLVLEKTFINRHVILDPDDTRYLRTGCYYYKVVIFLYFLDENFNIKVNPQTVSVGKLYLMF